jgi:hypothetical protein
VFVGGRGDEEKDGRVGVTVVESEVAVLVLCTSNLVSERLSENDGRSSGGKEGRRMLKSDELSG